MTFRAYRKFEKDENGKDRVDRFMGIEMKWTSPAYDAYAETFISVADLDYARNVDYGVFKLLLEVARNGKKMMQMGIDQHCKNIH